MDDRESLARRFSTLSWAAQEVMDDRPDRDPVAADLWGIGLLLHFIWTGTLLPFQDILTEENQNDEEALKRRSWDIATLPIPPTI